MTLPAFKAAGTGSETAPAWPTHIAGDFALLFVATSSGTLTTPTDSIWTLIYKEDSIHASVPTFGVWYRFATSDAEATPTLAGGASYKWGTIITYTGVNTSSPFHSASPYWMTAETAVRLPGITTLLNDSLVVLAAAWATDSAGPLSSGEANAALSGLAERYDAGTVTGDGGGIVILDGGLATLGTIGFTSITGSVSMATTSITLALQAVGQSLPTTRNKTRIINTRM